jgi:hypothetical protein
LPGPIDLHVPLGDQCCRLSARQAGSLGDKQIEADITVRLDGKLSDITQMLDLCRCIRY